jgi:hypothetical protein
MRHYTLTTTYGQARKYHAGEWTPETVTRRWETECECPRCHAARAEGRLPPDHMTEQHEEEVPYPADLMLEDLEERTIDYPEDLVEDWMDADDIAAAKTEWDEQEITLEAFVEGEDDGGPRDADNDA